MKRENLTEISFRSYDEMVDKAVNGSSEMADANRQSKNNTRLAFNGGATWEKASELAKRGDIETAKKLANTVYQTATELVVKAKRLDPVYNVEHGNEIDIDRFIHGIPETWLSMEETQTLPKRGVNIVINLDVPAHVRAEKINEVGASIGGAVIGLQASGYTVSVFLAIKSQGEGRTSIVKTAINPDGGFLDIAKLASCLQPWFLRRMVFSVFEQQDFEYRKAFRIGGSYGSVGYLTPQDAERIAGTAGALVIQVGSYVNNPAGAKEAIEKIIG